jgi:prepilin-type N-terminal cleavage/methylation domain-containing protein
MYNPKGFTLVEIILVVAVILILAASVLTGVADWISRTRIANEQVNIQSSYVEQQINDSEAKLANYGF